MTQIIRSTNILLSLERLELKEIFRQETSPAWILVIVASTSDINRCLISPLRTFYKQFGVAHVARRTFPSREIHRNRDNRANLSVTGIYSLICEFLGKTGDVDANRRPHVQRLIISKDASEVDAPRSFIPFFLYLCAWIRARTSP